MVGACIPNSANLCCPLSLFERESKRQSFSSHSKKHANGVHIIFPVFTSPYMRSFSRRSTLTAVSTALGGAISPPSPAPPAGPAAAVLERNSPIVASSNAATNTDDRVRLRARTLLFLRTLLLWSQMLLELELASLPSVLAINSTKKVFSWKLFFKKNSSSSCNDHA